MTIKIFLGNLSENTSSDKIRPLFEKYGEVVECDVLKNFGFVHMVNKNEANKAIAQLDGHNVDGKNIRVELSTGKKGPGGGGGKFDKKGFGGRGGDRGRPYGPPPGRGDPRDYDRYPYPPLPPAYDRYDPYYRYMLDREAYLARLAPLPGDRGYPAAGRERYPPLPPRDRMADRYPPDPRERLLPPPRGYLEERARADPYFRERDPLAARPPPEYYDRKLPMGAGRGAGGEPAGAAGAAAGRGAGVPGAYGNGVAGDFYGRAAQMERLGGGGGGMGGAAGGAGGGGDYFRQGAGAGQQGGGGYGRPGMGGGMGGMGGGMGKDSQTNFAQDPVFF